MNIFLILCKVWESRFSNEYYKSLEKLATRYYMKIATGSYLIVI